MLCNFLNANGKEEANGPSFVLTCLKGVNNQVAGAGLVFLVM
jgi:hypothetical protein